jgi:hypothetical protein
VCQDLRTTGSVTATNQKKLDVHKQTQRSPESSAMGCSVPVNENEDIPSCVGKSTMIYLTV